MASLCGLERISLFILLMQSIIRYVDAWHHTLHGTWFRHFNVIRYDAIMLCINVWCYDAMHQRMMLWCYASTYDAIMLCLNSKYCAMLFDNIVSFYDTSIGRGYAHPIHHHHKYNGSFFYDNTMTHTKDHLKIKFILSSIKLIWSPPPLLKLIIVWFLFLWQM